MPKFPTPLLFTLGFLCVGPAAASTAPRPGGPEPGNAPREAEATRTIEMHTGIAGLVYIGQPLEDLQGKFPTARSTPYARQEDVVMVQVPEAGISCLAVGPPGDMKIASVGLNWSAGHEGLAESAYRTSEGIGKGSTVNDLLEAYGRPARIALERASEPAPQRDPPRKAPGLPPREQYWYRNGDDTVTTYFVIESVQVARVVINHLAPLDRHILKRRPEVTAPAPPPAPQSSPSATPTQP